MLLMRDTQNVPVSRRRTQRGEDGTRGTGCYRHPSRVPTQMSRGKRSRRFFPRRCPRPLVAILRLCLPSAAMSL